MYGAAFRAVIARLWGYSADTASAGAMRKIHRDVIELDIVSTFIPDFYLHIYNETDVTCFDKFYALRKISNTHC